MVLLMAEGSTFWFYATMIAAFILTVLACRLIIPILRERKVGQEILTDYVAEHADKAGTPTMGGIGFIIPILLLSLAFVIIEVVRGGENVLPLALTICLGIGNAMIGFIDDYTKLCHRQNQGLTSRQKFFLQVIVAALYVFGMAYFGELNTVLTIEALDVSIDFGVFYYLIALIVIVGMVNSTNLTDGIDGLAASVALVASMATVLLALLIGNRTVVVPAAAMIGGMVGFLVFNYHPAKVFMGDTGSLFLGGMLIGMGFMLKRPLIMVLICFVFVLDMLSSLIQIISIRVFHKKVFKIAPVHHQFQKDGWSEEKIVYVFAGCGLLFAALGITWFCILFQ